MSGLLDGEDMFIKPEGFDLLHNRGGGAHRLRANTEKWKPLGIGDKTKGLGKAKFTTWSSPSARLYIYIHTWEDNMHYRRLGRSGLKVSEISLGSWITFGSQIEKRQPVI